MPPSSARKVVAHHDSSGGAHATALTPTSAAGSPRALGIKRSLSGIWADLTRSVEASFPFTAGRSPPSRLARTSSRLVEEPEFDLQDSVIGRRANSFALGALQTSVSVPHEGGGQSPMGGGDWLAKVRTETCSNQASSSKRWTRDREDADATQQGRLARKSEPGRPHLRRSNSRGRVKALSPLMTDSLDLHMDSRSPRCATDTPLPSPLLDEAFERYQRKARRSCRWFGS